MQQLEIRDLTVEFASGDYLVRPLDHVNGEARSGELVLLLGPSGSGKTTLLSCLAGVLAPTSGEILLDGASIVGLNPRDLTTYRRRSVGVVFAGSKLLPSLTARENVEAPLRLAGVPGRQARARAVELLERFGLGDQMTDRPGAMSSGQQQRVAIARALAHDPPMILADEPTETLDYVQVQTVIRALRDLAAPGRVVIVSTHDHRLVPLADRVIRLNSPALGGGEPGTVELKEGESLFEQGDIGALVYIVAKGRVDLFRQLAEGGEALVRTCQPGDYFGELAPLLGLPRSVSARACTDAVVHGLTVDEFRERVGPDGVREALSSAPGR
jgi:putative ABC transport system ATP-binding protein